MKPFLDDLLTPEERAFEESLAKDDPPPSNSIPDAWAEGLFRHAFKPPSLSPTAFERIRIDLLQKAAHPALTTEPLEATDLPLSSPLPLEATDLPLSSPLPLEATDLPLSSTLPLEATDLPLSSKLPSPHSSQRPAKVTDLVFAWWSTLRGLRGFGGLRPAAWASALGGLALFVGLGSLWLGDGSFSPSKDSELSQGRRAAHKKTLRAFQKAPAREPIWTVSRLALASTAQTPWKATENPLTLTQTAGERLEKQADYLERLQKDEALDRLTASHLYAKAAESANP